MGHYTENFIVRTQLILSSLLLGLLVAACQSPVHQPAVTGIYWDLLARDTLDLSSPLMGINRHPTYCVRFTTDSIYSYVNATEREVIDLSQFASDVIYSYSFTQRNDSLFFNGGKFRIVYLRSCLS